jgi:hypothetical protein
MAQRYIRKHGIATLYQTLDRERFFCELKQRLTDGNIDVDGSTLLEQSLVDHTVAIPTLLVVAGFWQRHSLSDEAPECIGLRKRLTVELVNPLLWTVGRDDYQRAMLVVGLSNGRSQIEQCRAAGDTDGDGLA